MPTWVSVGTCVGTHVCVSFGVCHSRHWRWGMRGPQAIEGPHSPGHSLLRSGFAGEGVVQAWEELGLWVRVWAGNQRGLWRLKQG